MATVPSGSLSTNVVIYLFHLPQLTRRSTFLNSHPDTPPMEGMCRSSAAPDASTKGYRSGCQAPEKMVSDLLRESHKEPLLAEM